MRLVTFMQQGDMSPAPKTFTLLMLFGKYTLEGQESKHREQLRKEMVVSWVVEVTVERGGRGGFKICFRTIVNNLLMAWVWSIREKVGSRRMPSSLII